MSKLRQTQLKILDKHLLEINIPEVPSGGWIHAIRSSLGMTLEQLSNRLNITKQSVARLEKNESNDSITLHSLRKTAEALECKLVYTLVPKEGSIQKIIQKQARLKANEIVSSVDHTMKLESQEVDNIQEKIEEISEEFSKNPNSKLWE